MIYVVEKLYNYFADGYMLSYILAFFKVEVKNSKKSCVPKPLDVVWGGQTGKRSVVAEIILALIQGENFILMCKILLNILQVLDLGTFKFLNTRKNTMKFIVMTS